MVSKLGNAVTKAKLSCVDFDQERKKEKETTGSFLLREEEKGSGIFALFLFFTFLSFLKKIVFVLSKNMERLLLFLFYSFSQYNIWVVLLYTHFLSYPTHP
uniref:Uncharacterized protein n=1 Tax=Cacopsylla melanoneura TaxID=428564 RepID=A0A8D8PXH3_9HEMI